VSSPTPLVDAARADSAQITSALRQQGALDSRSQQFVLQAAAMGVPIALAEAIFDAANPMGPSATDVVFAQAIASAGAPVSNPADEIRLAGDVDEKFELPDVFRDPIFTPTAGTVDNRTLSEAVREILADAEEGSGIMGFLDDFIQGATDIGSAIFSGAESLVGTVVGVANQIDPTLVPQLIASGVMNIREELGLPAQQVAQAAAAGAVAPATGGGLTVDDQALLQQIFAMLNGGGGAGGMTMAGMLATNGSAGGGVQQAGALSLVGNASTAISSLIARLSPAARSLLTGAGGALAVEGLTGAVGGLFGSSKLPTVIEMRDAKGRRVDYVRRGRPLLYSSDVAAAKRVRKTASRVRRAVPKLRASSRVFTDLCAGCTRPVGQCACKHS